MEMPNLEAITITDSSADSGDKTLMSVAKGVHAPKCRRSRYITAKLNTLEESKALYHLATAVLRNNRGNPNLVFKIRVRPDWAFIVLEPKSSVFCESVLYLRLEAGPALLRGPGADDNFDQIVIQMLKHALENGNLMYPVALELNGIDAQRVCATGGRLLPVLVGRMDAG